MERNVSRLHQLIVALGTHTHTHTEPGCVMHGCRPCLVQPAEANDRKCSIPGVAERRTVAASTSTPTCCSRTDACLHSRPTALITTQGQTGRTGEELLPPLGPVGQRRLPVGLVCVRRRLHAPLMGTLGKGLAVPVERAASPRSPRQEVESEAAALLGCGTRWTAGGQKRPRLKGGSVSSREGYLPHHTHTHTLSIRASRL